MKPDYLPVSRTDMSIRGWNQCDFVYVIGDAYVDAPFLSARRSFPEF